MRQVAATAAETHPDLEAAVGAALDLRLRTASPRPVAVALSGGGDSLALLLAADAWARGVGRDLVVLNVDHGLNQLSAAWTAACAATAARLGRPFRALAWAGDKPASGLPAAARAARHALLADAARAAGARVILLGHTADDVAEARHMRATGSTTPEPRDWSPSPAWPQGRGLFLLRPLLGQSRAAIRAWLSGRAETWIEDPANDDLRYARIRARFAPPSQELAFRAAAPDLPADLACACHADASGGLALPRDLLRAATPERARRFVSAACLCAGGGARPPARPRVEGLLARLTGDGAFISSLAGARITADATLARFAREPGEAARGGLQPLRLAPGETAVWDGRFEVCAHGAVLVRAGRQGRPEAVTDSGEPATMRAEFLGLERLRAACGVVDREPA